MKRVLPGLLAGLLGTMAAEAPDSEIQRARAALEASSNAYRNVVALRDRLSYVVSAPGSEQETKTEDYAFAPQGGAMVKNALLQAVAVSSKFYLTQSDVPDKYVAVPYDGDFGGTLRRVAGNGSLFEPPPLALHLGKGVAACIDALRFNLLEPLRIAGFRQVAGERSEIRFLASNGELTLAIDSKTHFFAEVSFQVRPPGAGQEYPVRVNGTFSPEILSGSEASIDFTPGSRSAVSSLAELTTSRLALGSPAPDFEVETLDGNKVALRDQRGSVVLLDFWATWCVPCWKALKESQSIADWASAEKLPVKVFAVNSLEQGSDPKEKLERVRHFWKAQGFTIPTLVDGQSKMFKAYQSPGLPSVVLIAPAGTIFRYHEGVFPEMLETLKRETEESLQEAGKAGSGE